MGGSKGGGGGCVKTVGSQEAGTGRTMVENETSKKDGEQLVGNYLRHRKNFGKLGREKNLMQGAIRTRNRGVRKVTQGGDSKRMDALICPEEAKVLGNSVGKNRVVVRREKTELVKELEKFRGGLYHRKGREGEGGIFGAGADREVAREGGKEKCSERAERGGSRIVGARRKRGVEGCGDCGSTTQP